MWSEPRERLLAAITAKIPPGEVAEIHFFKPLRQGGVESGVAVVAATAPTAVGADGPLTGPRGPGERFTVYTARYRLVLKGPDRGKWEASVVAEADAPILTVDAVVRGVQHRAGDLEPAERLMGEELRTALGQAVADGSNRDEVANHR